MQIPRIFFDNTFLIAGGEGYRRKGTCFIAMVEGVVYVFTAAHVADWAAKEGRVTLVGPERKPLMVTVEDIRQPGSGGRDVVAMQTSLPSAGLDLTGLVLKVTVEIGQEARFLGYPLGCSVWKDEKGYGKAFLKAGIVSSFNQEERKLYIDGMSVSGFSGGPVLIEDHGVPKIVAAISGSIPDRQGHPTGIVICEYLPDLVRDLTRKGKKEADT